ncbi:PAS domain S-box-containing protein [Sphingomonas gellani]|uniref:histidine kinase n=2 Tax=Sphingomonas gellani TaxID=1166340 RepID=A0A1H8BDJ0_9SPHN|nr:PAS domain S-box-containing protein [Sphingomonas gellani]
MVIGKGEDLTREESRVEIRRLRATEGRLRTILDAVDTAFAIVEVKFDANDTPVDYRFLEANPAFERQSGADLVGKWVTEYAPDLERFWFETYGHVAKTGEPANFENYANTFERWFDVRAIRIGDPRERRIAIFFNDVTERKRAEAQLVGLNDTLEQQVQDRTTELDRLWDTSPDLLLVIDFDGVFRRVNPAWVTTLGYDPDELVGHHVNEFVVAEDHADTIAAYQLAAMGGSPRMVNRYVHKDGTLCWISWVAARAGQVIYAFGRNVTAERTQAEALAQAEEALRHAQKMEAIGQLTGGVAHDFNNLLTVIRGSVDLLRRPGLTQEKRDRYVEAIASTAERATKLTNQLLAFARRQTLKPQVCDVGARLRGVADMLDTVTGGRIGVVTDLPPDPCYVLVDLNQFETALVNLAVNARDAMAGEGTLSLSVRCDSVMPPIRGHSGSHAAFAAISVADTGTGIEAEQVERIFEPFFTTKEVGKGTGLGLSQVLGFVKQSGGDVEVSSVPGRGTTFTLYLPQVDADRETAAADTGTALATHADGQRVLVVEDNLGVGRFCTDVLADLGYQTVWAHNAEEALKELDRAQQAFSVVFSDVVMPGMGGIELATVLRDRFPDLPVLLTSGYSDILAQEGGHGFDLLHKPYSAQQLATALRRVTGEAAVLATPPTD